MPTFRQYMELPDGEREAEFRAWCKRNKRATTEDGVGDDFLDDFCSETDAS